MLKDDLKIIVLASDDGKSLTIYEMTIYSALFRLIEITVGGYFGYKVVSIIRRKIICKIQK